MKWSILHQKHTTCMPLHCFKFCKTENHVDSVDNGQVPTVISNFCLILEWRNLHTLQRDGKKDLPNKESLCIKIYYYAI